MREVPHSGWLQETDWINHTMSAPMEFCMDGNSIRSDLMRLSQPERAFSRLEEIMDGIETIILYHA